MNENDHCLWVTTLAASAKLDRLVRRLKKVSMLKDRVYAREFSALDEASCYPSRTESEHLLETVVEIWIHSGEDFHRRMR